ncbi:MULTISPECIES: hypothetical protein [Burkholderiaceae]|uniref:hypothetical protein n=1 Tax=Burkholderiaceae TaxID=119060 RepID=UPI000978808E|nr:MULTISPECIES: hypothetical protein [Burkholderiaceae]MCF2133834.1 hypothetical protein [Mycetohabitans sp. B3]MCG1018545.1 hypothetical protein [Mycetohabitans sp. B4]MCG1040786.1 hypothetical protein [Mycetohabitans sp. B7]
MGSSLNGRSRRAHRLCGRAAVRRAADSRGVRSAYRAGAVLESENKTIEVEDAKPEWIEAGANVLLHAMLERACEPR